MNHNTDNNKGFSLEFYDKRIQELEDLLKQSQSQTLKVLIKKAIDETNKGLAKLLTVEKETVTYLKLEKSKTEDSVLKIDEKIELLNKEIDRFEVLDVSEAEKNITLKYLNEVLAAGKKTRSNKEDVLKLSYTVMTNAAIQFENLILNIIYKPNSSSFHYDTIVDALNFIAGKFIPGFEELLTAKDNPMSVKMRKKKYVKSGDKILTYIEQYIDVLGKWEVLADQYLAVLRT